MKKIYKKVISWLGCIFLSIILTMSFLSCMSDRPENLGLQNGQLSKCPSKPNCVCTFDKESDEEHYIKPMPFTKPAPEVMQAVKNAVKEISRAKIITENEYYLHVECTSFIFRFVDDLEIYIDDKEKLIHFRSASRVGHSDLGVNRKRVDKIKSKLKDL